MGIVQKLHGSPKIIVSDRDPIFTEHFWIELFSCLGTQLAHSSSYHPQSDGQTDDSEQMSRRLPSLLMSLINKHNGSNGYPWQNGGITLPFILQQK
jgi:hypothetical protein